VRVFKDLIKRSDVVSKGLLRMFKRFFKMVYDHFLIIDKKLNVSPDVGDYHVFATVIDFLTKKLSRPISNDLRVKLENYLAALIFKKSVQSIKN
jgi:hypothetical protein